MKKLFRPGPVLRISMGIVLFMVSLVLSLDAVFGLLPNERKQQAEVRQQVSQALGGQISAALSADEPRKLEGLLERLVANNPEIRSIGVRQANRSLLAASRTHALIWKPAEASASDLTHVVVPLFVGKAQWGEIELLFVDSGPGLVMRLLRHPATAIILLFSTMGLAGIYFFLRKILHNLDPSQAVPQRVRKAFDTLTEAVLILDTKGRIMLASSAFERLNLGGENRLEGSSIKRVDWLIAALADDALASGYPWDTVLRSNETMRGRELKVTLPDGSSRELRMNCSAISDGGAAVRGCLVTFDDVTQLSAANALLQRTLRDLEHSNEKIRQQNEKLEKHAHFDHLTGCMNRRAFFSRAEPLFQDALTGGSALTCIMCDIDYFKSFNDCYGHAVGDLVIQQVAAAMGRSLRADDLWCRYGGEEFCLLLVNANRDISAEVAERIRTRVEAEAGLGVRSMPGLRVTMSLGLASLDPDSEVQSLEQLIEYADQALYAAKHAGRNGVAAANGEILSHGAPPQPQSASVAVSH
ncbi:MAG TPA: diguanylate cyclase [Noviherbaspirillum sp.]|nr:diguanylate cyclase [Noviherbaspirillum sp.]